MVDVFPLHDGFGVPIDSETYKEQAERRDHRHQTKIGGGEQSSEKNSCDHLDRKRQALGKHRDASAADSAAPKLATLPNGLELTIFVKWSQISSVTGMLRGRLLWKTASEDSSFPS
jgi:hypothetical protein